MLEAAGISGDVALDAMPYVDVEYNDAAVKQYVDKLVTEEMRRENINEIHPSIAPVAPKNTFDQSWFLRTEQRRVELGHAMKQFDGSRYGVNAPKPDQCDGAGWDTAIRNAIAQNEMQAGRLMNLEILNQFGQNAWKRHAEVVDAMHTQVADALAHVQEEIQQVNGERNANQMKAGNRLHELETEWHELVYRNYEIQQAIGQLNVQPVPAVMS